MKLTPQDILDAAFAQLDADGLAGLNMRAVGRRLDAQGSALYWHVGSKDQLLGRMAETLYRTAIDAVPSGLGWEDWLRRFGREFRGVLARHRDAAQLCAIAPPVDADPQVVARELAAPLAGAGLTQDRALACLSSVTALTLGWTIYEQSGPLHDHLLRMFDFDAAFHLGLDAMVQGFATATHPTGIAGSSPPR